MIIEFNFHLFVFFSAGKHTEINDEIICFLSHSMNCIFAPVYFSPKMVHLVLHPHGIVPTFLKLDLWSLGMRFIPIIYTNGIN